MNIQQALRGFFEAVFYLGVAFGFMLWGYSIARDYYRKEAIKEGAAFYSLDPSTGETKFEWRKCE